MELYVFMHIRLMKYDYTLGMHQFLHRPTIIQDAKPGRNWVKSYGMSLCYFL